jgi:hypothetical protein
MTALEEEELKAFQIRCSEAEKALEDCNAALELIPLRELEQGQTWIPSEVAIRLLKKAKNSVAAHITTYMDNGC